MKKTNELLSTPVTVFKSRTATEPKAQITLSQWLAECSNTQNPYAKVVHQIREEIDKTKRSELKATLPLVCIGAQLKTRAKEVPLSERVIAHTGLMQFDIDPADNPSMDPKAVRDMLANVRNVIYCGLSASGLGVWGIVQVKQNDRAKDHFKQLQNDFDLLGLKLDPSKGSNPTDLRYYSFDPDAYLAKTYKVYERLPVVQKQVQPGHQARYTNTPTGNGIETAVRMIHQASDGTKHHTLLKAAHLAGGIIASGLIPEADAIRELESAIRSKGNIRDLSNAEKTIRSGIEHGKKLPLVQNRAFLKPNTIPQLSKMKSLLKSPDNNETISSQTNDTFLFDLSMEPHKLNVDWFRNLSDFDQTKTVEDQNGEIYSLWDFITKNVGLVKSEQQVLAYEKLCALQRVILK